MLKTTTIIKKTFDPSNIEQRVMGVLHNPFWSSFYMGRIFVWIRYEKIRVPF